MSDLLKPKDLLLRKLRTFCESCKPEYVFLVCAFVFGLLSLILTPPFQSPDEINHFYRSYQVSEGGLFGERADSRVGGYLPAGCVHVTEPFLGLSWNMHGKTEASRIREAFQIPLDDTARVFVDFPNTAMYPPVCYLPQALGIFVLKKLGAGPLALFYAARFCGLLFWIFGMFKVIRLMPFYRWVFVLLALLPMSVFIHMSVSADTVTNVLSFLTLAYLLKLIFQDNAISSKHYIFLCFLTLLLALSKLVYIPLILPALLIPTWKFGGFRRWLFHLGILFLLAFTVCVLWSGYMNGLYLAYKDYNPAFRDNITLVACADMHAQKHTILADGGWHFICVMFDSLCHSFDMYFQGYIGVFGWLDTKLPEWFIWLAYAVIVLCVVLAGEEKRRVSVRARLLFGFAAVLILILILLTQHLTWDCVGADLITTIQGRYFIPVAPLLFFLFYNRRFRSPFLLPLVVMSFSVLSLSFMSKTLYDRYYVASRFESEVIRCNAEIVTPDSLFATDKPGRLLGNTDARTGEQARSGSYALKLHALRSFGFTYKVNDLDYGDVIRYSVWRRGSSGGLVVSDGKDMFIMQSKAFETDRAGWEHLELTMTLQEAMKGKEIGFYLFNNARDSSYFDDVEIALDRLK